MATSMMTMMPTAAGRTSSPMSMAQPPRNSMKTASIVAAGGTPIPWNILTVAASPGPQNRPNKRAAAAEEFDKDANHRRRRRHAHTLEHFDGAREPGAAEP